MSAELISKNGNEITVQFTVELTGAMLNDEQALQQSLNEAGQVAMMPILEHTCQRRSARNAEWS